MAQIAKYVVVHYVTLSYEDEDLSTLETEEERERVKKHLQNLGTADVLETLIDMGKLPKDTEHDDCLFIW